MAEKKFRSGEVIFQQGEDAGSFYQIIDGTVGIYLNYGKDDELKLTQLTKDQYFGEMGVIENYPRSATAVALSEDTTVLELAGNEVIEYLKNHPENVYKLIEHMSSRLRDLTKDYNDVSDVIRELGLGEEEKKKSEGFLAKLRKYAAIYKANERSVDSKTAEAIFAAKLTGHSEGYVKKVETFPKGTVICREGETRTCMYDIHWGKVGIYSAYGTEKEKKLTELYPNSFFGEAGMISGEPRSATAVALEDGTVVEIILPEDLDELFKKNPPKIFMLLEHVSGRLRKLTDQYVKACGLVYEAAQSPKLSEALSVKIREYKAQIYD